MTSRDFCYWLQGYFEISSSEKIDKPQLDTIKRHLDMVFEHEIDPSFGGNLKKLKKIHNPGDDELITC